MEVTIEQYSGRAALRQIASDSPIVCDGGIRVSGMTQVKLVELCRNLAKNLLVLVNAVPEVTP